MKGDDGPECPAADDIVHHPILVEELSTVAERKIEGLLNDWILTDTMPLPAEARFVCTMTAPVARPERLN